MSFDWNAVDSALVCQALEPFLVEGRRERIDATIDTRLDGLTLLIENLHDPHNGAAVLRSAEAFGIHAVHVVEAAEKFRFSSDVSQGCEKWLNIERHPTFAAARTRLKAAGFFLYAAVPDAPLSLQDLDFGRPAAIVVGNEHAGLSEAAIAGADARFSIPMSGMTRSLNLSVAAAVISFHGAARRRDALGRMGDLDDAARIRLRARYYVASVRGAEQIVSRHLADK
ncbi:MAG: RNA methyltransferase [Deltaproteobacteria bacterium]|nr:RNA methyltransferase [Deltaproteobacteria bacterium]